MRFAGASFGFAVKASYGELGCLQVRLGRQGKAWFGKARHSKAGFGLAGKVRPGLLRSGKAGLGLAGEAWFGRAGQV